MKRLMIIFALFSFTQDNAAEIEAITRGEQKSLLINEVGFGQEKKKDFSKVWVQPISLHIIQLPEEVKMIIFGNLCKATVKDLATFCKDKKITADALFRYFYKVQKEEPLIVNGKQLNYSDVLRLSEEQRGILRNVRNPHIVDRFFGRERDIFYNEEIDSLKAVPSRITKGLTVTTKKSACPSCYESNMRYFWPCFTAANGFCEGGVAGILWCVGDTAFHAMGYVSAGFFLGAPVACICVACAEECCTTVEERTF